MSDLAEPYDRRRDWQQVDQPELEREQWAGMEDCASHGTTLFVRWLEASGRLVYGCQACRLEERTHDG